MGISTSRLCDRRAYRGRIDGEYRMRAPSLASRSRTRGWRTATGPMPVMISRSGRWPWRTTRCWPVSVLSSLCFARNSATSASMAWVSSARAPLRRISVRESLKAPGWASLITLLSDTAYHSFIGEVEAWNTTTIRRLTRSPRHQLLALAPRMRIDPIKQRPQWQDLGAPSMYCERVKSLDPYHHGEREGRDKPLRPDPHPPVPERRATNLPVRARVARAPVSGPGRPSRKERLRGSA